MTTRRHPPRRSADQATMSISLPAELKARIQAAADAEYRSMSGYIAHRIEQLISREPPPLYLPRERADKPTITPPKEDKKT